MLQTLYTDDGTPYEYGPRVLSVFRGVPSGLDFVRRFLDLAERDIYQGTRLRPDYPVIPFPVDRQSLSQIPDGAQIRQEMEKLRDLPLDETNLRTYLESSVGPTLTRLAFEGFNQKFWGREIDDLPASWGKLRRLERIAEEGAYRLPSVAPHYYPEGGFNPLFEQLLSGFDVRYDSVVQRVEPSEEGPLVYCGDETMQADLVISTAPIDELLGYRYGKLEWRGYRLELETADGPALGRAPDGVPFSWLYTPWAETPVCRTTDFGVIHQGREPRRKAVVAREIPSESVRMYPVSWEEERFTRYLTAAAGIRGFIPLGRLGLYKYVTTDSTFAMIERFLDELSGYDRADDTERLAVLGRIRGDWSD
jgi:UDP-galactopyranose mutase